MDPLPPQPPPPAADAAATTTTESPETLNTQLLPPPPPSSTPNPLTPGDLPPPSDEAINKNNAAPYQIPPWSEPPSHPFCFEVLKDGSIVDQLDLTKKGAYMFGRIDLCDFVLEHPTISRFHAVIQFNGSGDAYLYDLGSTHGTFINKKQVKAKVYVDLHVGDVIRFGHSSRLYIFQGPEDLMLPEADVKGSSYAKDREASLRRAREGAALADGISWGMGEDAIEETEDDPDELTWQTYKGELTEKQQKTREKVLKRMEKIAHMKKEISAIRAKDISQGGLTQGQQTQIARNELRISQIFEELESLEETLNDSIRESLGARGKRSSRSKLKGLIEDEDEMSSDEDEFYDRTKKKTLSKSAETEVVETADSLLDKQDALMKEMEEKRILISEEKNKISEPASEEKAGDVLDAFMSGLSSQLVADKALQLEKELSSLQTELDRIVYLLKIADPTGETAKKRATMVKEQICKDTESSSTAGKKPDKSKIEKKNIIRPVKPVGIAGENKVASDKIEKTADTPKSSNDVNDSTENKPSTSYMAEKPQWLGAVVGREPKTSHSVEPVHTSEGDEFVDYKDRQKILESTDSGAVTNLETEIENAAPGLILRRKKLVATTENQPPESSVVNSADTMVEDAVALLLKHKRGLYAIEEEAGLENDHKQLEQENKRPKRVLGPERPAFLETKNNETWVPPTGQSGDGRTALNDRLGY